MNIITEDVQNCKYKIVRSLDLKDGKIETCLPAGRQGWKNWSIKFIHIVSRKV
jgi:hypothetical protein